MAKRVRGRRQGWPAVPRGPEDWVGLQEIALGRHLVADIGWVSARRERALAAGVTGLPPPPKDIDDGFVSLPAVTVVGDDGRMRMFRLPVTFIAAVRHFTMQEDGGDPPPCRMIVTRLPCHFVIGDRETVYLLPDNETDRKGRAN